MWLVGIIATQRASKRICCIGEHVLYVGVLLANWLGALVSYPGLPASYSTLPVPKKTRFIRHSILHSTVLAGWQQKITQLHRLLGRVIRTGALNRSYSNCWLNTFAFLPIATIQPRDIM